MLVVEVFQLDELAGPNVAIPANTDSNVRADQQATSVLVDTTETCAGRKITVRGC